MRRADKDYNCILPQKKKKRLQLHSQSNSQKLKGDKEKKKITIALTKYFFKLFECIENLLFFLVSLEKISLLNTIYLKSYLSIKNVRHPSYINICVKVLF